MSITEEYVADTFPKTLPAQQQNKQPGLEKQMNPSPIFEHPNYNRQAKKLEGKVAIITGGDSGIGRAVAIAYANEGADIAIIYKDEHEDANETKSHIDKAGRKCMLIAGDIGDEKFCIDSVNQVANSLGKIDILVNNAAEQHQQAKLEDITREQLERTFKTNIFGVFFLTKAVLPHLKEGSSIINTSSITAYKGSQDLIDYSATKGALATFTRSLSTNLASRNIRVNAVAPGPIWTPLIPSSFTAQDVAQFGKDVPMGRVGEPVELAQAYVFLASNDSSYITGQAIHINGGTIING
jgi:NAD(P)-dependent dehydrogenase (short-subunit alcohol dehydrogenase family)